MYDSKQVDGTDSTDKSLYFTYLTAPPSMTTTFAFSPQNEGLLSTYDVSMTASYDVPIGSSITLTFDTSLYPSNLSSTTTSVSVTINGVSVACTVTNGVITIPTTVDYPAGTKISMSIANMMNPPLGSTKIVGQITNGSTILAYDSAIGPVVTKATPDDMKMTKLTASTTAL